MTLPPFGPPRVIVDRSEGPPAGEKRQTFFTALVAVTQTLHVVFEVKLWKKKRNGKECFTLTTISFFSKAFPSGNFSPKHMLMVYLGELPLLSLNCFSSEHRYGWRL